MTRTKASVRIIGGKWRGCILPLAKTVTALRPTHDRVRETLFNWLMAHVQDAVCLDCFAGSGALGFEALSRGAAFTTFIVAHKDIILSLTSIANQLAARNCEIIQGDCPTRVAPLQRGPYDIIFVDPPFKQNLVLPTVEWLVEQQYVKPQGWIYLEVERGLPLTGLPKSWCQYRQKHTATIDYYLYQAPTAC